MSSRAVTLFHGIGADRANVGLPCDPECSAKHNRGVNEVFHESARVSLSTRAKGSGSYSGGRSGCIIA